MPSAVGSGISTVGVAAEQEKISVEPNYQYLRLQPGNSANFTVTVTNRENVSITLNPKMVITPYTEKFMDESWINITPSEGIIEPGKKAQFVVKVVIPKDAEIG